MFPTTAQGFLLDLLGLLVELESPPHESLPDM
jgi:hypothetical protein